MFPVTLCKSVLHREKQVLLLFNIILLKINNSLPSVETKCEIMTITRYNRQYSNNTTKYQSETNLSLADTLFYTFKYIHK